MSIIKGLRIIGYKFIIVDIAAMSFLFVIDKVIFNFENKFFNYAVIIIPLIIFTIHLSNEVAKVSGWTKIADKFGIKGFINTGIPKKIIPLYGSIGDFDYAFRLFFNENGILIKVIFLFRSGHKNLMIPWSAISKIIIRNASNPERGLDIVEKITLIGSKDRYAQIILKDFPDIKIELPYVEEFKDNIPKDISLELKD